MLLVPQVLMKLYNSMIVAKESVHNDKMMSAYMCEFVSFNVLDKDYVENFFLALSNFYPSYRHWMYTIELLKKLINHNTLCEVSVRSFRTQTIFAASDNHGR